MANDLAGFDPDLFRTNITNTMVMGLPTPDNLKPTFYFKPTYSYPSGTVMDPEGRPIDPRVRATATSATAVKVPCAVEYQQDTTNDETLGGTFFSNRAMVTVLDIHYATIQNAIEVDLAGRRYLIQQVFPVGLGPVTVYQLQCFMKGTGGSE